MPETNQETLTILYTNDIHSHFETMGRIAAMIDDLRAEAPAGTLLLDIGDHMDRAAIETEGTLGQANVDVLNLTGYDAITIGNNEGLTFTPELLSQTYAGLHSSVVCGNIVELQTGQPPAWMRSRLVVHKDGFKIGLVAATAAFAEFYELLGLVSQNPLDTIARDVGQLRGEVDLVIVMSHLGLPLDRQLAETVTGIDLIIGGHTHHLLEEPLQIGSTWVTAAGKFGNYLGKVVVRRDLGTGRLSMDGVCLPVVEGPKKEKIESAITLQRDAAKLRLNRTVAVTDRELPVSYSAESPFGNLLAQAVRRHTGSEFSLVNSGQLLANLPAGEISEGMLHERCPSPINPCTMRVSGEDILASLEESLLEEKRGKSIMGFGFRGKVLGGICVDGLEIEYDPAAPPCKRIVRASLAGELLREEQTYLVGTLDMFTFGVGYERLKQGTEKRYMLPEFLRDLLRFELQTAGAVETCFQSRWKKVE
ncbi:bifunctional metallophosphatase/5'-nucleotidase [Paenibacillus sp. MBLB2552]|uniref:Bifunctional metallophosphatase/5'-nucleotidase n=1 Tax=Paenibacillus mellifer TaxID=2937794 RepID=A0A9X1Y5E6_9BACL|nr:bifunctional UDP-sugar hydrolase/5'-nucleotidase [Paenibacillus mellifer]MCK8489758.1 bifunctional metallophosphatase/5'-nucleotidase [Paenibacillus mellifer]